MILTKSDSYTKLKIKALCEIYKFYKSATRKNFHLFPLRIAFISLHHPLRRFCILKIRKHSLRRFRIFKLEIIFPDAKFILNLLHLHQIHSPSIEASLAHNCDKYSPSYSLSYDKIEIQPVAILSRTYYTPWSR
jgi:hypothetical protein